MFLAAQDGVLDQVPRQPGAERARRQGYQRELPPAPDAGKDLHDRLLDWRVEQIDAVGQVAERNFWRAHEPEPESQIGDRESSEITGVGELQQHRARAGRLARQRRVDLAALSIGKAIRGTGSTPARTEWSRAAS